jgi:hypothetical protein
MGRPGIRVLNEIHGAVQRLVPFDESDYMQISRFTDTNFKLLWDQHIVPRLCEIREALPTGSRRYVVFDTRIMSEEETEMYEEAKRNRNEPFAPMELEAERIIHLAETGHMITDEEMPAFRAMCEKRMQEQLAKQMAENPPEPIPESIQGVTESDLYDELGPAPVE